MQSLLREKLLTQGIKLGEVSNVYRSESHRFVGMYLAWLEEAVKDLAALRSPVGILLQAEKSTLTSVLDGYVPDQIQAGRSIRKNQKAVAAQSLERVSKEIYSKIENIDHSFDQLNEKLCHAVAVLASKEPELYKGLEVNQHGVDKIWQMLGGTPETIPMYNYFCAKLASPDRDYLILHIIQNIVSGKIESKNPVILNQSA